MSEPESERSEIRRQDPDVFKRKALSRDASKLPDLNRTSPARNMVWAEISSALPLAVIDHSEGSKIARRTRKNRRRGSP